MRKRTRQGAGALVLAVVCLPAGAQLMPPDLGYVDTGSAAWARFFAWVDEQETSGPPYDYGFTAKDAAYVYRVSGEDRFCTLAVSLVEQQVAEAEACYAGCPSPDPEVCHSPTVANDSYLYIGDHISDLAIAYDWCSGFTTSAQRARWAAYAEQAVWNVWNYDDALWGGQPFPWSGWSVSNPGNNYHFSFLEATFSWAQASSSAPWMSFLSDQKIPPLITYYQNLPGGGSREGTGYGLSHRRLFHFYRIWQESTGQDLAAQSSHAADELDYWLHATVPTFAYVAPIGDQARVSMPALYDYHRALVLEGRYLDPTLAEAMRASWWLNRIPIDQMTSRFNYRHDLLPVGAEQAPNGLVYHATGVGHLFARSSWDTGATWMAFVAGPYDESHAHQDQGSFTLFKDTWLAVTENVFSHSGIQQGGEVHNLVRFDSSGTTVEQTFGSTSTMSSQYSDGVLTIQADLTPAYSDSVDVTSWQRNVTFEQGRLQVQDLFAVAAGVEAVWQVNTPAQPVVQGDAIIAGDLVIRPLVPASPTVSIIDWTTLSNGETYYQGWKVELRGGTTQYQVELAVPSVDSLFSDGFETGDTGRWSWHTPSSKTGGSR